MGRSILQEERRVLVRHCDDKGYGFADRKRGQSKRGGWQGGWELDHAGP